MKRLVATILTGVMVLGVCGTNGLQKTQEEVVVETERWDEEVVQEPEEYSEGVHIITDDELSRLYSLKTDELHDTCLSLTTEEAELLMRIARAEGGKTLEGQLWVMGVIINRLLNGTFGDSIYEIVSAYNQFKVYSTGVYKTVELNANSHLALAEIEKGNNPTKGCLYFEACSNTHHSWHALNRVFVKEVQGQRYYK